MTPEERASLVERDKKHVWHPYTQMSQYRAEVDPLVIERADGSRLQDADGRSIIDGNSSWWTALLGHNHPRLVSALRDQSSRLCHTSLAGVTHEPAVRLAEELLQVSPPGLAHAFFSDNGSTSVEAAVKMAIQYYMQRSGKEQHPDQRKTHFLSLQDAFHGETMGVTALSGVEAFRKPFVGMTMPVTHLPSPADGLEQAVDALASTLKEKAASTAALVIEPLLQGAGGMKVYSPEYLKEARRLTEEHDVLLIVDEVFTGYGRTARFWACEHAGIVPDILCSAKGLSGGVLPLAATLVSERVFEAFLGDRSRAFYYGHTYCGNPLGAAVAAEVLAVYRDEQIVAGAVQRAALIEQAFSEMGQLEGVVGARSCGVCGALNLGQGGDYLQNSGWQVFQHALAAGAYVRPLGNVVYVCPPLNIPFEDLHELLRIVRSSVEQVLD